MKNNKKIHSCPCCEKKYNYRYLVVKHLEKEHSEQTTKIKKYKEEKEEKELKEYIDAASKKHNNKYNYSKVVLEGRKDDKITIICKEHGDFVQRAYLHKSQGNGCPKCSVIRVAKKQRSTKEEIIKKFIKIHGEKYCYSKVKYETVKTPVEIYCKTCNKTFKQEPRHHREGKGCPTCAPYGFDNNSKAILYYLRIITKDTILYKIGITNNSLRQRYGKELDKCEVIKIEHFENGFEARKKEKEIIDAFMEYAYEGEKIFRRGNTEIFTHDVLGLDPLSKQNSAPVSPATTLSTPKAENKNNPLKISNASQAKTKEA